MNTSGENKTKNASVTSKYLLLVGTILVNMILLFTPWISILELGKMNIWKLANVLTNYGSYLGAETQGIGLVIYIVAGLALGFLAYDLIKAVKGYMQSMEKNKAGSKSCVGHLLSLGVSIVFIIAIMVMKQQDYVGNLLSVTAAPVFVILVSLLGICVAANMNENSAANLTEGISKIVADTKKQISQNSVQEFAVMNYSPSSDNRIVSVLVDKKTAAVALEVAAYSEKLPAMRVDLDFTTEFGDVVSCESLAFLKSEELGEKMYRTEFTDTGLTSEKLRELRSVKAYIRCYTGGVAGPADYLSIPDHLNIEKLKNTYGRDAVCEDRKLEHGWICCCGRENDDGAENCSCCGRSYLKLAMEEEKINLLAAETYTEFREMLARKIEKGNEQYVELQTRIDTCLNYVSAEVDELRMARSMLKRWCLENNVSLDTAS